MPVPGEIWRHSCYYVINAVPKPKYLLVLAVAGGDVVYRLTTSRKNDRPDDPACFHGDPYPGYFLGVIGSPRLTRPSWLDLRECDDHDLVEFNALVAANVLALEATLPHAILCPALLCATNAGDTTGLQTKRMYQTRAQLNCP
jgi:hypothetical protein